MKRIFIVTGEPSGDKLASKVILKLKEINPNIQYLCVGGVNLEKQGVKSIFIFLLIQISSLCFKDFSCKE